MRVRVTGIPVSCRWEPGSLMRIPLASNSVMAFPHLCVDLAVALPSRFWWISCRRVRRRLTLLSFITV